MALLTSFRVAFRQPEGLYFANPGESALPPGWIPADEENQPVLLANSKGELFDRAGAMPPDSSLADRYADVELGADGNAEITVRLSATGYESVEWGSLSKLAPATLLERIQADLRKRYPEAVVHAAAVAPSGAWPARFAMRYIVSVPHYASMAGRRWLVPPFYFQKGHDAVFASESRRFPLAIDHAYLGRDSVTLHLPLGLHFEVPAPPPSVTFPWGWCQSTLEPGDDSRSVLAVRTQRVGNDALREFPPFVYPAVHSAFAQIWQTDQQVIVARADANPAATEKP
jgi:hypothetical protein